MRLGALRESPIEMDRAYLNYQFTAYSWTLIVSALVGLAVAYFLWRRRGALGARYLAFVELAAAEWAFAIAFEAAATRIPLKLLWSQIAYAGTTATPLFYFLFALAYSKHDAHLTRRNTALLSIVPIVTIAVAATNSWHGWLWPDISLIPGGHLAAYAHGPWFWVFVIYTYALVSIALVSLWLALLRFPKVYRSQIVALLVGSALPIVGNLMYLSGLNPIPGVDWTPLAFLLSGLVLACGILRLRMFDLVPVARGQVVDTMSDGVLVMDAQDRIIDLNPAIQAMAGLSSQVIGQPVAEALSHWPELVNCCQWNVETELEICLGEGETSRYYDARLSVLRDRRGQPTGQFVVLREITKRKRLEEEQARLVDELQEALAQVKTLSGLLPICASCKRIRDDQGYWHSVEKYVREHSEAEFTHSICPQCMKKLYPEYADLDE